MVTALLRFLRLWPVTKPLGHLTTHDDVVRLVDVACRCTGQRLDPRRDNWRVESFWSPGRIAETRVVIDGPGMVGPDLSAGQ